MICGTLPMSKVSLATYSVRLKDNGSGVNQILDKFGPQDRDLLNSLLKCLEGMKSNKAHDATAKHVMNTLAVTRGDDRTITGTIESGIYGRGSRLRHVEAWTVTHTKTAKEADMLPFYFLFCLPEMADEGILILERAGNAGNPQSPRNGDHGVYQQEPSRILFCTSHFGPG